MNHNVSKFNCIYKDCNKIANSNKDPLHCNIHDNPSNYPLQPRLRNLSDKLELSNVTLTLLKTKSLPNIINKSKITPLEPIISQFSPKPSPKIDTIPLIESPILSRKSSMSDLVLNPIKPRRSSKLSLNSENSNILNPIKPRRSSELSLPIYNRNLILNPIKPRRSSELSLRNPKHELQLKVDKAKEKFAFAKKMLLQYSPIEHSVAKVAALEDYYQAEKEVEEACKAWCRC